MINRILIAAVVVTYNRHELLIECLEALRQQSRKIDTIIIVDNNSNDGTYEAIKSLCHLIPIPSQRSDCIILHGRIGSFVNPNDNVDFQEIDVSYIKNNKNEGGAGGMHAGINYCLDNNYDLFWLMDDDGLPSYDALEKLLIELKSDDVALNCLVVSKSDPSKLAFKLPIIDIKGKHTNFNGNRYFHKKHDILEFSQQTKRYPWAAPFNGMLVRRSAVEAVGNVRKDLFIWGDEVDFFYRLKKHGPVNTVIDSIHYHPEFNSSEPPAWKMYYGLRNDIYIHIKYRNLPMLRVVYSIISSMPYFMKKKEFSTMFRAIIDSIKLLQSAKF